MNKNKISLFLKIKGQRQADLMRHLTSRGFDVSRQAINNWASGRHNPVKRTAIRKAICHFFELEDKDIFDNNA